MKKSIPILIVIVIILAAVAAFYYTKQTSAVPFTNGNISFEYPNSFTLTQSPITDENSSGYFVCALNLPSSNSAIIIYQVPIHTTRNVTNTNQTRNVAPVVPTNNTTASQSNITINNTKVTNQTIVETMDNLQAYLDGVITRGGTTRNVTRNNYTNFVSTGLKNPIANYNTTSRTSTITLISINETAIVKDGSGNFYVIELLNGDNNQDVTNAFNQIVNSFRILS